MAGAPRITVDGEDTIQSMQLFGSGVGRMALDLEHKPKEQLSIDLPETYPEDGTYLTPNPPNVQKESDYMFLVTCARDYFKADMVDMMKSLNINDISASLEVKTPPPLPARKPKPKATLLASIYRRQESPTKEDAKEEDLNLLVLHNLDVHKVEFVKGSRDIQNELTEHLKRHRAWINWENVQDDTIPITEVKSGRRPSSQEDVQAWREETELTVKHFFSEIMVRKIMMMQTTWTEMKERDILSTVPVPDHGIANIIPADELPGVIIVGRVVVVSEIASHILSTITTMEEGTLEKDTKQRTSMHEMSAWKLKYLKATDFPSALSKKYKGLKAEIDMEKKIVDLSGNGVDVTKAKFDIQEALHGVEFRKIEGQSKIKLQAYTYDEFIDYIQEMLAEKHVNAVFEVLSDELLVYGKGQTTLDDASKIIVDAVKVTYVKTDGLPLEDWKNVLDSITHVVKAPFYIDIVDDTNSPKSVLICATSIHDVIMAKLREATQGNNVLTERQLKVERGIFLVLKRRCTSEMNALKSKYKVNVTFEHASCVVVVQGPDTHVHRAVEDIKELTDKIVMVYYDASMPGTIKFLNSITGDSMVKQAEDEFSCIIDIQSVTSLPETPGAPEEEPFRAKVTIVRGNICEQLVDVIANSVNKDLDLSAGLVGKALVDAAGSSVQKQLNRRYSRGLKYGEIAVTAGGHLRCKSLFHCCLPHWKNDDKIIEVYQETLKLCLEYADVSNYSSIAFPALGCGRRGYPLHLAARAVLEAIRSYEDTTNSGIKEINIVVLKTDVFTAFDNELSNRMIGTAVTERPTEELISDEEAYTPIASNVSITVKVGELSETKADVIVNSTNTTMDLSNGAVSSSILKIGGNTIQQECKRLYSGGIQTGQVVPTTGGRLRCKNLYHCCLPKWAGNPEAANTLSQIIDRCLEMAATSGSEKIAFPALGTGVMKYPPKTVAEIFKSRAAVFSQRNPLSFLKEIIIVLYYKDTDICTAFNTVLSDDPDLSEQPSSPENIQNVEFRTGHVHLEIKNSSIFKENVDAIIVPTDNRISLNDPFGKRLIAECGHGLMTETQDANIKKSGAVITSAKNLPTAHIMFVSTEYFKNNMDEIIKKCFRKADKNKIKSISIPHIHAAIDTEGDMFGSAIVKAVQQYKTSLRELREINIILTTPQEQATCIFMFRQFFGNPTFRRSFILNEGQRRTSKQISVLRTKSESEDHPVYKGPQLRMLGTDQNQLVRCQEKITTILKENVSVTELEDPAIGSLTQFNVDEIKTTCDELDVAVEILQNDQLVRFSGVKVDTVMAYSKTRDILKRMKYMRIREEKADLMSAMVQWYYVLSNVMHPFTSLSNMFIEEAYKKGQPKLSLVLSGGSVDLDFHNLVMNVTETRQLKIVREEKLQS